MSDEVASTPDILHFAGPPHRLRSIGPIPQFEHLQLALDVTPDGELARAMPDLSRPVRARAVSRHSTSSMRLKMDRKTPPGAYRATISAGERRFLTEISVEASPRLSAWPAELRFDAAPGEEASVDLTLENKGNVDIDIPETTSVGIYDDNGIETAFASTYRQETREVQQLVGYFIDRLREGHGGLLKIRVEGAGLLRPGERRRATLQTRLPAKLKGGHAYHGVWNLETLHASVRVLARRQGTGELK